MRVVSFALGLAALSLAGCSQQPAAQAAQPLTQADAQAVLDDFARALSSMDLQKVDDMYAADVVAFDPGKPERIGGKVALHVMNAQYVDMKFNHVEMPEPKFQILGPDLFIASGTAHFTGTDGKTKEGDVRYSEVFQKQPDGNWQSIHEHLDYPPKT